MLVSLGLSLLGVALFAVLWPVIDYLRGRRGLRKYPVQNLLSGLTERSTGREALSFNTLYYIVKHPEAYKRVRAEIDEALSPDDAIAPWDKVKDLPFLKACIDEAERLAPGVAGDLPRRTPPGKDYMVAGVPAPGDTNVSISAYTAQRDPDIFLDPKAFKPERWLIKGDGHLKKMLDVYLVFTIGSRMCMGKSVTVLIQSVYLATLLHRYDFALANPDWVLEKVEFFNQWPRSMPMKIWRREWQTTSGVSV